MEKTYIYGNLLRLRLSTAVAPLHSQSTEILGIFNNWKNSHKKISWLIRLTINTNLFISKNLFFHFFLQNKVALLLLTSANNKTESEMAYNTAATMDNLACTDYVDFSKCHDRLGGITWSKNFLDYLDVKLKVFNRDKKTFSTGTKLDNGRGRLYSVYSIEKSASSCSQRLQQGGKSTSCASEITSEGHGEVAQTFTQICRNSWSTTQKGLRAYDGLHCGEARDFICSSAIVWKKKGRRKIQSNCLCEL